MTMEGTPGPRTPVVRRYRDRPERLLGSRIQQRYEDEARRADVPKQESSPEN